MCRDVSLAHECLAAIEFHFRIRIEVHIHVYGLCLRFVIQLDMA